MTGGYLHGGWEYIWGGYGLTWATLSLYTLSLFLRSRRAAAPESR